MAAASTSSCSTWAFASATLSGGSAWAESAPGPAIKPAASARAETVNSDFRVALADVTLPHPPRGLIIPGSSNARAALAESRQHLRSRFGHWTNVDILRRPHQSHQQHRAPQPDSGHSSGACTDATRRAPGINRSGGTSPESAKASSAACSDGSKSTPDAGIPSSTETTQSSQASPRTSQVPQSTCTVSRSCRSFIVVHSSRPSPGGNTAPPHRQCCPPRARSAPQDPVFLVAHRGADRPDLTDPTERPTGSSSGPGRRSLADARRNRRCVRDTKR